MATIFETIIQPLIPLLKEEANQLKNGSSRVLVELGETD